MKSKLILIILSFVTLTFAQKTDYTKEPGYFEFGNLPFGEKIEPITEINIEEPLLKMMSNMVNNKDSNFSELIGSIKLIRVSEYELKSLSKEALSNKINTIDKELLNKNWERIVKTKSGKNIVNIYVKPDANKGYSGLVITSIDNNKVSFVNIVGKIDLTTVGKLSEQFNIPSIDSLKHK
ncbi:DUF4252 domain-containing protein [Melioribacteraceae bacterium 4301-Me]|uniref:DUF4252 domain-containing protein n=1 Tax=Pyranulibacter aquaticus TaxID=3163344 RepID=UPI00359966A1